MKKVLLASAALVAFGATAAQAADPVKLSIGGFATEFAGYAQNNDGLNLVKFDQQDDVNINFVGSTKLDNGISVIVEVDTFGSQRNDTRNGNTNCGKAGNGSKVLLASYGTTGGGAATCDNSDVKRSFVALAGGFGTAILGEREDVGYIVHNSAPSVGATGLQDGYWWQWVASPVNHRAYTATNPSRYDDRTNKISYVTPAFYGLAAGVTYVPSISLGAGSGSTSLPSNQDNANFLNTGYVNGSDFGGDLYVGGLAYANKFGDVGVKADAGVGQANIANLRVYQGGTQVSYAGFTFGGSILNRQVPSGGNTAALKNYTVDGTQVAGTTYLGNTIAKTAAYAGQSWDAGVSYATGPYSVSVGYFHDNSDSSSLLNGTGKADSTDVWELGVAYILGPGVTLKGSLGDVQYKGDVVNTTAVNGQTNYKDNNKGVLAVTAVKVDF